MADSPLRLTEGQLKVLKLAESGHNICLMGKAGVGKSTVVLELTKRLSSKGKKCHIVSSSGVSCEPYNGVAKTVHSQYGLQTCELPKRLLLERALKRKHFRRYYQHRCSCLGRDLNVEPTNLRACQYSPSYGIKELLTLWWYPGDIGG